MHTAINKEVFNMKTVFPWMHPKHKALRILHNSKSKGHIQNNPDKSISIFITKDNSQVHLATIKDSGDCSYRPTL